MSTTTYALATGWTIDRGRNYELDKMGTGTASISTIDTSGLLDPTNATSPFQGKLQPMKQAGIAMQNPVTGAWSTLYRGYANGFSYDLDITEKALRGTVDLVDAMDVLSRTELVPGQAGGTDTAASNKSTPTGGEGDIFYAAQNVDDRIRAALADGNWPSSLTTIFTGNVTCQQIVYPPRTTVLQVIQDAADAEFPGVANVYVSREGYVTFHGREARFNPDVAQYGIGHWHAGDLAAIAAGAGNVAPIASLSFARDAEHIYNAILSTPQNIADADIAGQQITDDTSITDFGPRSLSFENLVTNTGLNDGNGPNDEVLLFSTYYADNYPQPQDRIKSVTFRPVSPSDANAAPLWKLMCGVELNDLLTITTTHPGGGGFAAVDFFVEGIHYVADGQLGSLAPNVTLTLDLSPRAFYDTDPF